MKLAEALIVRNYYRAGRYWPYFSGRMEEDGAPTASRPAGKNRGIEK